MLEASASPSSTPSSTKPTPVSSHDVSMPITIRSQRPPHHHGVDPAVRRSNRDGGRSRRTPRRVERDGRVVVDAHLEEQFARAATDRLGVAGRRACARARPLPLRGRHDADGEDLGAGRRRPARRPSRAVRRPRPRPRRSSGCACRRARRGSSSRRPRLGAEQVVLVGHQRVDVRGGHRDDASGSTVIGSSPSAARRHRDGAGRAGSAGPTPAPDRIWSSASVTSRGRGRMLAVEQRQPEHVGVQPGAGAGHRGRCPRAGRRPGR